MMPSEKAADRRINRFLLYSKTEKLTRIQNQSLVGEVRRQAYFGSAYAGKRGTVQLNSLLRPVGKEAKHLFRAYITYTLSLKRSFPIEIRKALFSAKALDVYNYIIKNGIKTREIVLGKDEDSGIKSGHQLQLKHLCLKRRGVSFLCYC